MTPRPWQERLPGMPENEHREFALIVVRNYDFFYTRHTSDLLYSNHKPTVLEDER